MIGVDEAGRGPVLGPLVVAAVKARDEESLTEIGVRDSKKLSPGRRRRMYQSIKACCELSIVRADASDIDSLRIRSSLNQIEKEMLIKAVSGLVHRGEVLFVDCFDVNEERLCQEIESVLADVEVVSRHKADETFPCVSAASIVAKVNRDSVISQLDALSQERWGIGIGSGYPSDPVTRRFLEFIDESGEEMPFFVRRSWKTVGRCRQLRLDL